MITALLAFETVARIDHEQYPFSFLLGIKIHQEQGQECFVFKTGVKTTVFFLALN